MKSLLYSRRTWVRCWLELGSRGNMMHPNNMISLDAFESTASHPMLVTNKFCTRVWSLALDVTSKHMLAWGIIPLPWSPIPNRRTRSVPCSEPSVLESLELQEFSSHCSSSPKVFSLKLLEVFLREDSAFRFLLWLLWGAVSRFPAPILVENLQIIGRKDYYSLC